MVLVVKGVLTVLYQTEFSFQGLLRKPESDHEVSAEALRKGPEQAAQEACYAQPGKQTANNDFKTLCLSCGLLFCGVGCCLGPLRFCV